MHLNRILTLALIIIASGCLAQSELDPPLRPTLNLLTLDPESGNPTLTWISPSHNPLHLDPIGYIIYVPYEEGGGWTPIDSVDANTYTYTDINNNGLHESIKYVIASQGPVEPSPLTPPHGSINVTAKYDSCSNKIDIAWNQYLGWGNRIDFYNVYIGENPNWDQLTLTTTTPGTQNFAYYDVLPNKDYYIYVEAKKRNEEFYSKSNLTHINTRIAIAPQYMYVDSLIAKDQQNEIHFTIDANTEFRRFKLIRWESSDSIKSFFTSKDVFEFTKPSTTYFADTSDSWAARSRTFYYKINAYDGCNRLKRISNLSNTIIIRAHSAGNKSTISWEKFYSAQGNAISYDLYRIAYSQGISISELIYQTENPMITEYTDDLSIFEGQGYLPYFCYYIEANEMLGEGQTSRISRSRTICAQIDPDITMPNAIDPLSTIVSPEGIPRNIFAPTISFESTYKLTIYSRGGSVVYEGNSEGWDGRLPNGQLAPEGTYVYRLEVMSELRKIKSKTGTVTVMYGPKQ
ncbi:MAG: gliding motility-associated C-terminal domain-containing protein [Bacteroidales bacterium]|nr:gliding motility-associated C-terminal domain-containing protein [Bacteroidales bacterium]